MICPFYISLLTNLGVNISRYAFISINCLFLIRLTVPVRLVDGSIFILRVISILYFALHLDDYKNNRIESKNRINHALIMKSNILSYIAMEKTRFN